MAVIMDGKRLAEEIKEKVREDVEQLREYGIDVGLGLLLVGENLSSLSYYNATLKACNKVGIRAYQFRLPEDSSVNEILNVIHEINRDERINGLLVLFPLPRRINARRVVNEIVPEKDIDGLGAISVGRLAADESTFQIFKEGTYELLHECRFMPSVTSFLPCTPFGVIRLLEHHNIDFKGKHAVVVGKSLAVGKPLSMMLLAKEATVTVCHKNTHDLGHFTRQADILCSATGVRGLIKADMVKEGAVVVDIGINVLEDGSIVGDVEFETVKEKASYITPVPGGVGPVTISMLLENTVRSAQRTEFMKSPLMLE
ncbi:MAG TPA: bifunctional 5,10-methylene-tetrahydrofolate dehydrogenase/5,10-methylene-tetrahydrofolate cyclohydrolase [Nitrospirae bacterium]|nr:bifunctional 5,10-methylene-tetrahydrofolate dehydrogenase/5,10-methylene-tetrahydrofolate cyclohydrolase [Nitrospirota bacterium]